MSDLFTKDKTSSAIIVGMKSDNIKQLATDVTEKEKKSKKKNMLRAQLRRAKKRA
jgi:hypothetical protein